MSERRIGRYQQKKRGAPRTPGTRTIWCPLCFCKTCICSTRTIDNVRAELRRWNGVREVPRPIDPCALAGIDSVITGLSRGRTILD